jgi:hypothetical protein
MQIFRLVQINFFGKDKSSQGFVVATVKPSADSNNLVVALGSGLKKKLKALMMQILTST